MVSAPDVLLDFHEERMVLLADPMDPPAEDIPEGLDVQRLFFAAADDIVVSHNEKAVAAPGATN